MTENATQAAIKRLGGYHAVARLFAADGMPISHQVVFWWAKKDRIPRWHVDRFAALAKKQGVTIIHPQLKRVANG